MSPDVGAAQDAARAAAEALLRARLAPLLTDPAAAALARELAADVLAAAAAAQAPDPLRALAGQLPQRDALRLDFLRVTMALRAAIEVAGNDSGLCLGGCGPITLADEAMLRVGADELTYAPAPATAAEASALLARVGAALPGCGWAEADQAAAAWAQAADAWAGRYRRVVAALAAEVLHPRGTTRAAWADALGVTDADLAAAQRHLLGELDEDDLARAGLAGSPATGWDGLDTGM